MSERSWTPAQQDAIRARGGTLLVSAAAGSGKTAVLVQRVIERITDPVHPSDADRLLVVTFTKAAAAEMRERISLRLSELLARDPSNTALQRQQLLLSRAGISTVHSFCSELVRENFYKLDISPDFRISDDSEMAILRAEAVTRVLEDCYAENDPVFFDLVEAFSSDRDDSRLIETIGRLYDFIRSHPFPERWLSEKAGMYETGLPASRTPWGKCLLEFAREAADYCAGLTRGSLSVLEADEKLRAAYSEALSGDLAALERLRAAAAGGDWDEVGRAVSGVSFRRLGSVRGYAEDPLKLRVAACRDEVKGTVKKLAALFSPTERECGEDIRLTAPIVEKLFSVTKQFSDTLDAMKAERRMADFGDLEHWALRLLVRPCEGGFERTEDALEISGRYDEIMVDEYQDTNRAQDLLFQAVSRNGENLFLVGDVKQSIYSFRQAMPRIFLDRRRTFAPYSREEDRYPACIVLDRNFRSRREVTGAVNFTFGQLMSEQAGDVDYTGGERLVAGAKYEEQEGCETELHVLDLSLAQEPPGEPMAVLEARHIASLILQTVSGRFRVTESGERRPAVFRDFCILLRSANKYAAQYARELQLCGVPAWADSAGGFFESSEIAVMLSLLRVIDNPVQDIPLLSVLMSPIYGFTPDEVADIRLCAENVPVYLALTASAGRGNRRAAAFLEEMERFRSLAATMPSDRLLNAVYQKTGFIHTVQAMDNGGLRLANLHLLLEYAKKYEASGYNGLSGFIRFIDRLQEQDSDLPGACALSESANVVRVMSIHKSKGLEFPVCIVAGCARRFNKEHGDALLHPELGLGIRLKDGETLSRRTTLPREAIALETERGAMSEELRILYVAMTRAREKLILVTTVPDLGRTLAGIAPRLSEGERISPYVVRGASCISDWLLACALRHPCGAELRERAGCGERIAWKGETEPWKIQIAPPPPGLSEREEKADEAAAQPDPALRKRLEEKIGFSYPWASLRGIPAKVSASELAAQASGAEDGPLSRPAFLESSGLTPAERGTALHAYLQFADYKEAAKDPQAELGRLVSQGFLTREQAGAVDLSRVLAFLESPIASRMLRSPDFRRELRFTVEIPASRLGPALPDSPVILQGAVDCAFEEDGQMVIVDYKTDRAASPRELWERYRVQLELYRYAVAHVTGLPVKECLLYSFRWNRTVSEEKNS